MDIDRNKINEMKSECLQMPDYIRDMIEETVEQQLKKKQRYGKKMWRVAAAILAFACVGGGTTLAAAKLYNMHLEQQGKYGSTLIYGEATNTDATGTDAEVNQNALYTLDVSYVPEGMKVDGLDDIYADGNNYVKKVVLFPEDSSFIGGVSFWFLKMPADQQVSLDETHVISTKELDIDGRQAIVIERQVLESAIREVQYELYVTYENNYLLDMVVFDDTELDTAIDIVKGLKLRRNSMIRRQSVESWQKNIRGRWKKLQRLFMRQMQQQVRKTDSRRLQKNRWKNICIRSEKALMYRSLP